MFKNMLKRSFLSIKRKLGRTITLVLIFFMMANLVLAAVIIKSGVNAQMEYAKASLGGEVTIQADMDAIREEQQAKIKDGGDRKEMFGKMERPLISITTADEIANYSDYVKDYSYEIESSANKSELDVVESTNDGPGGDMMGRPGEQESESDDESTLDKDITISGINAYAYIDGVENSSIEIKDGTYFDETSDDKAMISYEFAELNELSVGDSFTIKNIYTEEDITLEVIGIYDSSEGRADANAIYMNIATAAKFLSDDDYNDGDFSVENATFYMQNSDKADEFVELINSEFTELAENNLKIAVDTSEYDAMSGSIESVGSFATTILVIIIVAAVVIITLIVTINIRDRRYEMGVLLSLGASKMNIIGQIAIELVVVGTIGFACASLTGNVLAQKMGDSILASQQESSQTQNERNFGRPGTQIGGGQKGGDMQKPDDAPSENSDGGAPANNIAKNIGKESEQSVELDINAQPTDYLILFVIGYLVIIVSLIIPSTNILRYQPKEILSGKE